MHFRTIAAGDVDAIMRDHAPNAALHWVDGPLAYALPGDLERLQLLAVAVAMYRELNP